MKKLWREKLQRLKNQRELEKEKLQVGFLFCFHVLIDAGDDAPS